MPTLAGELEIQIRHNLAALNQDLAKARRVVASDKNRTDRAVAKLRKARKQAQDRKL